MVQGIARPAAGLAAQEPVAVAHGANRTKSPNPVVADYLDFKSIISKIETSSIHEESPELEICRKNKKRRIHVPGM